MQLYGRGTQLAVAQDAIERLVGGRGSLLLLSGEPGIGKSTLAEAIADKAAERGAEVAWGRAWEAGGAPSLWPWTLIFRSLGIEDDTLSQGDGDDREARFRVFDRAAETLRKRSADRPLVLVLDDLHAADESTLTLLLLIAQRLRTLPLFIIGTHRDAEARAEPRMAKLFAKIAREGNTVLLPRLERDDLVVWLEEDQAARTAVEIDELHELTEGNPLFIKEALALAPKGLSARLRAGLSAVLDERLAQLTPACRELLGCAAVLGRTAGATLLVHVAGLPLDAQHALLLEAEQAGVLAPESAPRVRFSHVLLRDRLYASLSPTRRAELHWRAGTQLSTTGADKRGAAHHLLAGCVAGDLDTALDAARDACVGALDKLAFEDAVRIAEQALGLLDVVETDRAIELRILRAHGLGHGGSYEASRRECVEICKAAAKKGRWEAQARAALIHAGDVGTATVDREMVRLLREALAAMPEGDHLLRPRLMARLSMALIPPESADERREFVLLAHQAREDAERLGDPDTLLFVLRFTAVVGLSARERGEVITRTYLLAVELDRRDILLTVSTSYIVVLLEQGRRAEAEAILKRYEELLADLPGPRNRWRLSMMHALIAMLDGDIERMLTFNDSAIAAALECRVPMAVASTAIQRWVFASVLRDLDVLGSYGPMLLELARRDKNLGVAVVPWLLFAVGEHAEARTKLRETLELPLVTDARADYPALLTLAEAVILQANAQGAAQLYPKLAWHERTQPFFSPGSNGAPLGPTSHTLGDLALLLGNVDEAVVHYRRALELATRLGAKPLIARTKRMLAGGPSEPPYPSREARAAPEPSAPNPLGAPLLTREGAVWAVHPPGGSEFRLRHSKGLLYLSVLLDQEGQEVHALELIGAEHADSDAGPMLDEQARSAYRDRVDSLRSELEEAEQQADLGRAEGARAELDAIARELARAVGLGGRERKAGSHAERARINVQRCITAAIGKIRQENPELGRYLANRVTTGNFCSFNRS